MVPFPLASNFLVTDPRAYYYRGEKNQTEEVSISFHLIQLLLPGHQHLGYLYFHLTGSMPYRADWLNPAQQGNRLRQCPFSIWIPARRNSHLSPHLLSGSHIVLLLEASSLPVLSVQGSKK